MSHTNLLYHIVFATKERAPLITTVLRPELHKYLGGIVRNLSGTALEINGMAEHVHALAVLTPTISVSDFMSKLKANSSSWAKAQTRGRFAWPKTLRGVHSQRIAGRARAKLHPQSRRAPPQDDV